MGKTVRTVRFSEKELERIERFIEQNPLFDFSRLVRLSVERFISHPSITITPMKLARIPKRKTNLKVGSN